MKKVAAFGICLLISSFSSALAESSPDQWTGNWSSKSRSDTIAKQISIVRDKEDIKAKFFGPGSSNSAYLGEGVAEWYPDKNGRGAYITNFMKDGARMQVVIAPNSKKSLRANFYTKYDDHRRNLCCTQEFSRVK
jgi:hypothetical protein